MSKNWQILQLMELHELRVLVHCICFCICICIVICICVCIWQEITKGRKREDVEKLAVFAADGASRIEGFGRLASTTGAHKSNNPCWHSHPHHHHHHWLRLPMKIKVKPKQAMLTLADCPAMSFVLVCWQQIEIPIEISWVGRSTMLTSSSSHKVSGNLKGCFSKKRDVGMLRQVAWVALCCVGCVVCWSCVSCF